MDTNRRDFLKGTAWMGAAAIAAGCMSAKNAPCSGAGGSMFGFAAKPLKKIRVGCVGIGSRGSGAVHRLASIPGVVKTARSSRSGARRSMNPSFPRCASSMRCGIM